MKILFSSISFHFKYENLIYNKKFYDNDTLNNILGISNASHFRVYGYFELLRVIKTRSVYKLFV